MKKIEIESMYSLSGGTHLVVKLYRRFTIKYLLSKFTLKRLGDCKMTRDGDFLCIEYKGNRNNIISLMKEICGNP